MIRLSARVVLVTALLTMATSAFGQALSGSIAGTVKDATGGPVGSSRLMS